MTIEDLIKVADDDVKLSIYIFNDTAFFEHILGYAGTLHEDEMYDTIKHQEIERIENWAPQDYAGWHYAELILTVKVGE